MKKNIAVIGCGHWGKNLVRNYSELGSLGAVCDPNTKLAELYANECKVNNMTYDEILNNPNLSGVVIAAPAPLHASMGIEAMSAGKHVYVEKPLAMNKTEAQAMIDSAKKNNVKLMVGHLLQYHPIFIKVRKIVESGDIGSLNYIYSNRLSFGKVRTEEDVIWSFAPHDISMILSLVKQNLKSVKTHSSCILQPNISDMATIHLEFDNLKAHISVSWLHPHKEQKLVVIGDNGMIVFDDTKPWNEKLAIYHHQIKFNDNLPKLDKAKVEYVQIQESEPLKNECLHFIDVVNNNREPLTNSKEGLNVLNVLCAASTNRIEK